MGEYYLKCEPVETKSNLDEVLKFIDNPLFTNSIINSGFMKYISMIIGLILTTFLGYKTYDYFSDYLNRKQHYLWSLLYGFFTILALIITILIFTEDIKI